MLNCSSTRSPSPAKKAGRVAAKSSRSPPRRSPVRRGAAADRGHYFIVFHGRFSWKTEPASCMTIRGPFRVWYWQKRASRRSSTYMRSRGVLENVLWNLSWILSYPIISIIPEHFLVKLCYDFHVPLKMYALTLLEKTIFIIEIGNFYEKVSLSAIALKC